MKSGSKEKSTLFDLEASIVQEDKRIRNQRWTDTQSRLSYRTRIKIEVQSSNEIRNRNRTCFLNDETEQETTRL